MEFPKILIGLQGKSGDVVCIPRKSKENGIAALLENTRNSEGSPDVSRSGHIISGSLLCFTVKGTVTNCNRPSMIAPKQRGWSDIEKQSALISGVFPRAEQNSITSGMLFPSVAMTCRVSLHRLQTECCYVVKGSCHFC